MSLVPRGFSYEQRDSRVMGLALYFPLAPELRETEALMPDRGLVGGHASVLESARRAANASESGYRRRAYYRLELM